MKVRELIEWLATFPDQDAEVEVLRHTSGTGYYDQGGNVSAVPFDPEHAAEYTDLRNNQFVKQDDPRKNVRTLLLGEMNA